jgi:hypothetical protein
LASLADAIFSGEGKVCAAPAAGIIPAAILDDPDVLTSRSQQDVNGRDDDDPAAMRQNLPMTGAGTILVVDNLAELLLYHPVPRVSNMRQLLGPVIGTQVWCRA